MGWPTACINLKGGGSGDVCPLKNGERFSMSRRNFPNYTGHQNFEQGKESGPGYSMPILGRRRNQFGGAHGGRYVSYTDENKAVLVEHFKKNLV